MFRQPQPVWRIYSIIEGTAGGVAIFPAFDTYMAREKYRLIPYIW